MRAPVISVIVMALNEVNSIEAVVREIDSVLGTLTVPFEILVVDDGSLDGTEQIADRLVEQLPNVRVVHHGINKGLGAVYRTGFTQTQGKFVTFFPADGQFPATIIPQFVSAMDTADMVLGYVAIHQRSLLEKGFSLAERILYRILFGPLPKFQGVLMFRRALLDEIELASTGRGWAVLMELIIRASRARYRIVNVLTDMRPRRSGSSKVKNFSTIWDNLKQMIVLTRHL